MRCPACPNELHTIYAGAVHVDICTTGCGGVWFDTGELEKFDDPVEFAPQNILKALPNMLVALDHSKTRHCPRCSGAALKTHYHDDSAGLEVESCGSCGGVWLELGELGLLRDQNEFRDRAAAVTASYRTRFASQLKTGQLPDRIAAVFKLLF